MAAPENLRGLTVIAMLPDFIRADLIDDQAFLDAIELQPESTLKFSEADITVSSSAFFEGVEALYANPGKPSQIATKEGASLSISIESPAADVMTIRTAAGEFRVRAHPVMALQAEDRLAGFSHMIEGRGLPQAYRDTWSERLRVRPASGAEARDLDQRLLRTPPTVISQLEDELDKGKGTIEVIAPVSEDYYVSLVGAGNPVNVAEMGQAAAEDLIPGLLAWNPVEGAIRALSLASHQNLLSAADWSSLEEEHLESLIQWAKDHGDPFSQIGVVQVALMRGVPMRLEEDLAGLVKRICDLDPNDPEGRLQLFQAVFIVIEGQLSRQRVLGDWPPFRRRAAAFAQAAIVSQLALGQIQIQPFASWARAAGGTQFWCQTQADLSREPRWLPDFIAPGQLHAELTGRLNALAAAYGEALPPGPLKLSLTAPDGAVRIAARFPDSFRAGPLEGAYPGTIGAPPTDLSAYLDELLDSETLTYAVLSALGNLIALFRLESEKIDRAVALIQASGHRVITQCPPGALDGLFDALADAACMARSPALAEQVRIMCRRRRADVTTVLPAWREASWALTASAAYDDFAKRADLAGAWIGELAFGVQDRGDAQQLLGTLEALCRVEPRFRMTLGRAIAALEAFVRS